MKKLIKNTLILFPVLASLAISQARGEDLKQVYQAALKNDQTLKEAFYQLKQTAEQTPQAWAALLPTISANANAGYAYSYAKGAQQQRFIPAGAFRDWTYGYGATLSQPIFNFSAFSGLAVAKNNVKSAYATYSAAEQTLISSTISAYLAVLEAQEKLKFAEAEKNALEENYKQVYERFKVGVSTRTDAYQARASYDGSISREIAAKNAVDNALEALQVITNQRYTSLMTLSNAYHFHSPNPTNINAWVTSTEEHNWSIKAAEYTVAGAKDTIKATWNQHLPTVNLEGNYNQSYLNATNRSGIINQRSGTAAFNLNVPIYQGGQISSQVRQETAVYGQDVASMELTKRTQVETARTSYLAVVANVSQIAADRNTIVSDQMALDSVNEGYKVGTNTMLDVLNAQQTLYSDLSTYATDRYAYLNNVTMLKEAAGTLSNKDINALNSYLVPADQVTLENIVPHPQTSSSTLKTGSSSNTKTTTPPPPVKATPSKTAPATTTTNNSK
ncbi:MAG: TolC family outer membrane protein [Pseudomonadota bacterium]